MLDFRYIIMPGVFLDIVSGGYDGSGSSGVDDGRYCSSFVDKPCKSIDSGPYA
jgi:hypothetical protein